MITFPPFYGAIASSLIGFNPLSLSPALWLDSSDSTTLFTTATGTTPVLSGGVVGRMEDKSGNRKHFRQPTSGARPGFIAGDGIQFDGISQFLSQDAQPTFVSRTTLPNGGLGSVTGKGWTNTGLFWDAAEGCFWVGNDGRSIDGDTTYEPSIVKLSADLTTIIAQIDIKALWANNTTVQGVCVDTSDNSLWFAALQENRIRNLTKAGAVIGELTFTNPNGLAYDAANDRLIVLNTAGTVAVVNPSTGATVSTYSTGSTISSLQPDQIFFNPSNRRLYVSYGLNGSAGRIRVFDHDTGINMGEMGPFPEVLSVEGISIVGDELYICNDTYFHVQSPNLNEIVRYQFNGVDPIAGLQSQATVALVGRARTPSGATRGWFTSGRAISEAQASGNAGGYGIYPLIGDASLRQFINSEFDDVSVAGAGITADAIIILVVNAAAGTASMTVNGGTPTTFAITSQSKLPVIQPQMFLGCGELNGTFPMGPDRYSAGRTKEMMVFPGLPNRQTIEGYLASKWGLQSLLPSDHPYKHSRP